MADNFTDNPLAGFKAYRDAYKDAPGSDARLKQLALSTHHLDKLREECGIFGIWGADTASSFVALGLHALQHRGHLLVNQVDGLEWPDQNLEIDDPPHHRSI